VFNPGSPVVLRHGRLDPGPVTIFILKGFAFFVLPSVSRTDILSFVAVATMQRMGVVPSFSRPSVSNDNPFSEALFKTLKYVPAYPAKPFESLDAARRWVAHFCTWYNQSHRHSGLKFVTPAQRHDGTDVAILEKRKSVYKEA